MSDEKIQLYDMKDKFETIEIRFLGDEERKIMKSIRLNKPVGSYNASAELIYTRDISPAYYTQYKKAITEGGLYYNTELIIPQDEFDEMVLKAVRTKYPDAQMQSLDINTDACIERLKIMYDGYQKEQAVIYLTPDFSKINIQGLSSDYVLYQYRTYLDVLVPFHGFVPYFKNEGYFDNYDLKDAENVEKILNEALPTVKHLTDLW